MWGSGRVKGEGIEEEEVHRYRGWSGKVEEKLQEEGRKGGGAGEGGEMERERRRLRRQKRSGRETVEGRGRRRWGTEKGGSGRVGGGGGGGGRRGAVRGMGKGK